LEARLEYPQTIHTMVRAASESLKMDTHFILCLSAGFARLEVTTATVIPSEIAAASTVLVTILAVS
jgi:hypothetical protein